MILTRRTLLQSLPLGAVSPFLAPLVARGESEAAGKKPMRFVFVMEGNGLWPEHVYPKGFKRKEIANPRGGDDHNTVNGEEELIELPLGGSDAPLHDAVKPLEKHVDRLTLLTGLSGRICGGGHGNGFGALGAYPAVAGPMDITIDCALAKTVPAVRQIVSLGWMSDPEKGNSMFQGFSALGAGQKLSVIENPVLAHKILFGKLVGGDPQGALGSEALVLDTIAKEISQVRKRLPGEEGAKLDRLADAFAGIRSRQEKLGKIKADRIPPVRPDFHGTKAETTRMEAHLELAVTALLTGLTNTITLCSGMGYPTWKTLGCDLDTHTIGHGGHEAAAEAQRVRIRQFNAGLIAKLVDALEAVPEGQGSMMDNTLIVYLSDGAETHHSLCIEWPMVLVGNLGGRLKLGGKFINVPTYGSKGHVTVAQLYTALLHAAGAPVDHFGMKDRVLLGDGLDQREPWTHVLA